jgi:hypothetical protein
MNFSSIFAIYPPIPPLISDSHLGNLSQLIEYLRQRRAISVSSSDFADGKTLICQIRPMSVEEHRRFFKCKPYLSPGGPLLCFDGDFPRPGNFGPVEGARYTEADYIEFWKDGLPGYLDTTIQTYICALNLTFSGAAKTVENVCFVDNRLNGHKSCYLSTIDAANDFLGGLGWPEITLFPEETLSWVSRQNGIFDGYSDTAGSRALNYFTRLFVQDYRNDEMSDLIWAMAGIEALLVKGGSSSTFQLKEKLSAIMKALGIAANLENQIDRTYQFRSKMVHGNRNLMSAFRGSDGESESRQNEVYHSELFAVGVLLRLLQVLIKYDLHEFSFETLLRSKLTNKRALTSI